jgi:hypothetical protein
MKIKEPTIALMPTGSEITFQLVGLFAFSFLATLGRIIAGDYGIRFRPEAHALRSFHLLVRTAICRNTLPAEVSLETHGE